MFPLKTDVKYSQLDFEKGRGLIPTIVQNIEGDVLYLQSISRESLEKTVKTGRNWRFSRTKSRLLEVGSESGKTEYIRRILTNCYRYTLLFIVEQEKDYACHKGYRTCFFQELDDKGLFQINQERAVNPKEIYGGK